MNIIKLFFLVFVVTSLFGCIPSNSNVRADDGDDSSVAETPVKKIDIEKCSSPNLGVASLSSGSVGGREMMVSNQNRQVLASNGLPGDARPLLRLALRNTGCFTKVDKGIDPYGAGQGYMLANSETAKNTKSVTSDFIIFAKFSIAAKQKNKAASIGGSFLNIALGPLGFGGIGNKVVGAAANSVRFSSVGVTIYVTDPNTGAKLIVVDGSAESDNLDTERTLPGLTSSGTEVWNDTLEGKLVAIAVADATNKLIPKLQARVQAAKKM